MRHNVIKRRRNAPSEALYFDVFFSGSLNFQLAGATLACPPRRVRLVRNATVAVPSCTARTPGQDPDQLGLARGASS